MSEHPLQLRLRYSKQGGHTRIRVFAAMVPDADRYTLACCGEIVLRNTEFRALQQFLGTKAQDGLQLHFVEDDA